MYFITRDKSYNIDNINSFQFSKKEGTKSSIKLLFHSASRFPDCVETFQLISLSKEISESKLTLSLYYLTVFFTDFILSSKTNNRDKVFFQEFIKYYNKESSNQVFKILL